MENLKLCFTGPGSHTPSIHASCSCCTLIMFCQHYVCHTCILHFGSWSNITLSHCVVHTVYMSLTANTIKIYLNWKATPPSISGTDNHRSHVSFLKWEWQSQRPHLTALVELKGPEAMPPSFSGNDNHRGHSSFLLVRLTGTQVTPPYFSRNDHHRGHAFFL